MANQSSKGGQGSAPSAGKAFTAAQGIPKPHHSSPPEQTVNASARAQIENDQALERAVQQIERQWDADKQKISAKAAAVPSFDLGSRAQRNVHADYQELKFVKDQAEQQANDNRDVRRGEIRSAQPTLSGEFSRKQGPRPSGPAPSPVIPPAAPKPPTPTPAQAKPEKGLQPGFSRAAAPKEAFPVHAHTPSTGRSR